MALLADEPTRPARVQPRADGKIHFDDLPPKTQAIVDDIIKLGLRVWDRVQREQAQAANDPACTLDAERMRIR